MSNEEKGETQTQTEESFTAVEASTSDLPKIHTLVQVNPARSSSSDTFDIEQGENWLHILSNREDEAQATAGTSASHTTAPLILIISTREDASMNHSMQGCSILCIDVDGTVLAVKDARKGLVQPPSQDGSRSSGSNVELRIARKGTSTLVAATLEPLPRRQLRIMRHGDRLCVLSPADGTVALVLEYRYDVAIRTTQAAAVEESLTQQMADPTDVNDTVVEATIASQPMEADDDENEAADLTQEAAVVQEVRAPVPIATQPDDVAVDTDDDSTVDPGEDSHETSDVVGEIARRQESHSPSGMSPTLMGETEPLTECEKEKVPDLDAGLGKSDRDAQDEDLSETKTMPTPEKVSMLASPAKSELLSPNLMASVASPQSLEETDAESANDETPDKKGRIAVEGSPDGGQPMKPSEVNGLGPGNEGKSVKGLESNAENGNVLDTELPGKGDSTETASSTVVGKEEEEENIEVDKPNECGKAEAEYAGMDASDGNTGGVEALLFMAKDGGDNSEKRNGTASDRAGARSLKTSGKDQDPEEAAHPAVDTSVSPSICHNPAPSGVTRKRSRASPPCAEVDDACASPSDAKTRSTRKRSRLLQLSPTENFPIRVLVTKIKLKESEKNMIKRLGGELLESIEDAHTATHVIASDGKDSIRRTPKLMIGICRTPNIVTKDWLIKSSKAGKALPCAKFLVLHDAEAEKLYDFSMRQTLKNISSNLERGTFLLDGWWIFVCKGVAGNKAPSSEELQRIVEAAGGSWLVLLTPSATKDVNPSRLLLITGDPETKKQLSSKPVASVLHNGASKRTTAWLFHAIMKQQLDLPDAVGG